MTYPPGLYDHVSSAVYHGQPTEGASISSSGLRTILLDCPAKYWATSPLNPDREPDEESAALNFGRAAHCLMLGEPTFAEEFVVSPYDDFRTKEAREWRDGQERTIVRAEQMPQIEAMAKAVRASPSAARAFQNGRPEVSLFWQDEATGIMLKARPDWLPDDPVTGYTQEYKTARSAAPRLIASQAFQLGYDMQAALCLDGIAAVTGKKPLGIAHVVQEKEPPYIAQLYLFGPDQIEIGRRRYRKALRIFAACLERHRAGKPPQIAWPAYSDAPMFFETPRWIATADDEPNHIQIESDNDDDRTRYAAA